MNSNVQLEPPRWSGGPRICPYENLLAFETEKEIGRFCDDNCPSCSPYFKWKCGQCGHWHMLTSWPAPAGASSGNARAFKIIVPRHILDAFKAAGQQVKKQAEADGSFLVFFPVFMSNADPLDQQQAEQLMMDSKFQGDKYQWEADQRWRILPPVKGFKR